MTLKELFESAQFSGCVTIHLVEEGVPYQDYEGFYEHTERDFNGTIPTELLPYSDNRVGKIHPNYQFMAKAQPDEDGKYRAEKVDSISIQVYATPSDDICEFYNTGGNCYCGWCKVEDGWFMGGESSWGGVWKTYSQALEGYPEEDCGFIRYVNDFDELKRIWTHIYNKTHYQELLKTLDKDLANDPDVTKKI